MKRPILLLPFLLCAAGALAQNKPSATGVRTAAPVAAPSAYSNPVINYIRTWKPNKPLTDAAAVSASGTSPVDIRQATQYFDGLGRPLQTVQRGAAPGEKDVVAPVIYDAFGREVLKYLPYADQNSATGNFKLDPFNTQKAFYENGTLNPGTTGESVFYSRTDFEASPLNRPLRSYSAGNSWAKEDLSTVERGGNKPVGQQYLVNTSADAVRIWNMGPSGYPETSAIYGDGQLYKNVTTDEAGHSVVEYKDKEGQVVLKKVQLAATPGADHTGWLCTYYVYDDLNNLRFVVPPKAVELLAGNGWSLADATLRSELCFRYDYDERKRMIAKQVPGAAQVDMVYDARDRLVFTRDGNLRDQGKWLVTLYDELNRPIMTGLYTSAETPAQLQNALKTPAGNVPVSYVIKPPTRLTVNSHDGRTEYKAAEEIIFTDGFDSGTGPTETVLDPNGALYTETTTANNPLPGLNTAQLEPLTYTYYDHYNYDGKKTAEDLAVASISHPGLYLDALPISQQTKGLVTGSKVKLLDGSNQWLTTTTFYDEKGRVRQVVSDNATDGVDVMTSLYDFTNRVVSTRLVHRNPRSTQTPVTTVLTMLQYDHGGRVVLVRKQLNDRQPVDIATNEYDALGQLKKKTFKRTAGLTPEVLETLDYAYNIRGWLRGINQPYANGGSTGNYFGQELSYDHGFDNNQYNGNIAGIRWRGTNAPGTKHAYGYGYDAANRLLRGDFTQGSGTGYNFAVNPQAQYNVKMGDGAEPTEAYDANGNIKWMQQEGGTGAIDNLRYQYLAASNKLQGVKDDANNPASTLGDFKEITTGSLADYDYDPNGNLKRDGNKGITDIVYNHLNLPSQITIPGKGTISYVYDAAGIKHRKTVTDQTGGTVKTTRTDYAGGAVYQNDTMQFVSHEEGRFRLNALQSGQPVQYTVDYFVKDHLGNIRMVLTETTQQQLYLASMEPERSATENALFSNIETSRSAKPAGYPQDASAGSENKEVAKLNGNNPDKRVGPSLVLKVMAGDTISIGAKAFYKSIGTKQSKQLAPVGDMATALVRAFGGSTNGQGNSHTPGSTTPTRTPFNDQFINDGYQRMKEKEPADPAQANRPKAYLNFALFDDQFNLVEANSGVKQVKAEPDQLQTLAQDKMVIKQGGYLYVYTSNETPQDVFFDNVTVLNSPGPVLEETHYYPFGLTMAGLSTKAINKLERNKRGYNGNELQHDEFGDGSGLELYDFNARTYDQQIGRFIQIDPLTDQWQENLSPYHFGFNNPVLYGDPDGKYPFPFMNWAIGKVISNPNSGASKAIGAATGVGAFLLKTAQGIGNTLAHPIQTAEGMAGMQSNPVSAGMMVATTVANRADKIQNGTGFEAASAVSETVMDVLSIIVGTKGLGAALKTESVAASVGAQGELLKNTLPVSTNGKLLGSISNGEIAMQGKALSGGKFDFVLTQEGNVLLGRKHTFLSGGADVRAAGEMKIRGGKVVGVNNLSGHYAPGPGVANSYLELLKNAGVDVSKAHLQVYNNQGQVVNHVIPK